MDGPDGHPRIGFHAAPPPLLGAIFSGQGSRRSPRDLQFPCCSVGLQRPSGVVARHMEQGPANRLPEHLPSLVSLSQPKTHHLRWPCVEVGWMSTHPGQGGVS